MCIHRERGVRGVALIGRGVRGIESIGGVTSSIERGVSIHKSGYQYSEKQQHQFIKSEIL